eukprot:m.85011 g.85011  ORF g.85011 m.85011 type:complete len:869 (-) comp12991_c0_seq1:13-2619(-)
METETSNDKIAVECQELMQKLQRDLNCLSDKSKNTRKRALGRITEELMQEGLSSEVLSSVIVTISKPVVKLLADPVEKIRELSCEYLHGVIDKVPSCGDILPYLVPVIVSKLGQKDIEEESEEVRLAVSNILTQIVKQCAQALPLYLDQFLAVLQRTILDPYSEVRKSACVCVRALAYEPAVASLLPHSCKCLHKPLIAALGHQHSRVRVKVVEAIEGVVLNGTDTALDDFMVPLAQCTMDKAPVVRQAIYTAVGVWMLDLKDRYSYWHRLITLMLNGVADEVPDLCKLSTIAFHKAGKQWEKENEDNIKDELDFTPLVISPAAPPETAVGSTDNIEDNLSILPLGCRILVERELGKILPALLRDVLDWTTDIRRQSAKLLRVLLIYAQGRITMHLEALLGGLYKAVRDDEVEIADIVVEAATIAGRYVEPKLWVQFVIPRLIAKGASIQEQTGYIIVVAALIRGVMKENERKGQQEPSDQSFILDVCRALATEEVCTNANTELQEELLLLIADVIRAAKNLNQLTHDASGCLFMALLSVRSCNEGLEKEFQAKIDQLAEAKTQSVEELYREHTPSLLKALHSSHEEWTKHSQERVVFDTLLLRAGPVLGNEVKTIMDIFYCNFSPDKDAEIRLSFFTLLSKLLARASASLNSTGSFQFSKRVMIDIVAPNCVWQNGRVAAAIRTAAVACLWALLSSGLPSDEDVDSAIPTILPHMVACLDDDLEQTRLVVCRVLERLLLNHPTCFTKDYEAYDRLHTLYPELLKRLDDNNDTVRLTALQAWKAYAACLAHEKYDTQLYSVHIEATVKGLFIHLDDTQDEIQEAVASVLKAIAAVHPALVSGVAREAKSRHRFADRCNEIETFAESKK